MKQKTVTGSLHGNFDIETRQWSELDVFSFIGQRAKEFFDQHVPKLADKLGKGIVNVSLSTFGTIEQLRRLSNEINMGVTMLIWRQDGHHMPEPFFVPANLKNADLHFTYCKFPLSKNVSIATDAYILEISIVDQTNEDALEVVAKA